MVKKKVDKLDEDAPYFTEKELVNYLGISRSSIRRWQMSGSFPCRRKIGKRNVRWLRRDIEAWVESTQVVEPKGGKANKTK